MIFISSLMVQAQAATGLCTACAHVSHGHPPAAGADALDMLVRSPSHQRADDTPPPPLSFAAHVPRTGVSIETDMLLAPTMAANTDYLITSFDLDHMLYPFRVRAGKPAPPGSRPQVPFWDTDLKGANAGRFLMGAGNAQTTLR